METFYTEYYVFHSQQSQSNKEKHKTYQGNKFTKQKYKTQL